MIVENYKNIIKHEFISDYKNSYEKLLCSFSKMLINIIYIEQIYRNQQEITPKMDVGSIYVSKHLYLLSVSDLILAIYAAVYDTGSDVITINKFKNIITQKWCIDNKKNIIYNRINSSSWKTASSQILQKKLEFFRNKVIAHNLYNIEDMNIELQPIFDLHKSACDLLDILSFGIIDYGLAMNYNSVNEYFEKERAAITEFVNDYLGI